MLFDSYKHFLETPVYNKIIGDDYLIVEFNCPIKEEFFKAWSECHCIVYVLGGKKKWITPDGSWMVSKGQSIFVQKGAFMNQQYFEEGFCVLMFFMRDDFIKNCVRNDLAEDFARHEFDADHDFVYRIGITETLETLYNSFFSYLKQEEKVPQKILELKFREMLVNIMMNPENKELRSCMFALANLDETPIAQIMEDQFIYNLKIDEFARLCGKSLSSFKREFKKLYNTTPRRWLTTKRLEYARKLLVNTNHSVQEICYNSGFENDSHFNRIFKASYGLTPVQYRNTR
jgi:AraC-like DNA-binding protein